MLAKNELRVNSRYRILLIGVVVLMGEKNAAAAVRLLCTASPPRKRAEAKRVWCV